LRMKKLLYALPLCIALWAAGCTTGEPKPVDVTVVMKKYSITPSEIHVKKGDLVRVHLTSEDVQHSFNVPDLGVHEPVDKKHPAEFTFEANKAGTFTIECGIICGPGHDDMTGKLVVE